MAKEDVFAARVNYTLYGQNCVNVLHFRQTTVDGAGDARTALGISYSTDRVPLLAACLSVDCRIESIGVRRVKPVPQQEIVTALGSDGTVTGDALPPNATLCITLYAATDGRRSIGRQYLPGVAESVVNEGTAQVAFFEGPLTAFAAESIEPISMAGWAWQQVIYAETDTLPRDILATEPRPVVRNLRSRTIGQGT